MERESIRPPDINELLNVIQILKNALNFYANEENYKENIIVSGECMSSQIEIDKGYTANFALKTIENINKYQDQIIDDLRKAIKIRDTLPINMTKETEDFVKAIKEMNNWSLNIENITNNIQNKDGKSNENK